MLRNEQFSGNLGETPSFNDALSIDASGVWYYFDQAFERLGLIRLFYTILHKTQNGFVLKTPVEIVPIRVEDAPFAVIGLNADEQGNISLLLNDETYLPLNSERILRQDFRNILYVNVFERDEYRFEARFTRNAYLELANYMTEYPSGALVLRSFDTEFVL